MQPPPPTHPPSLSSPPSTIPSPHTCGAACVHPTQLMPGVGRQFQRPEPATAARSSAAAGPGVLRTGSRLSHGMLGPVVAPRQAVPEPDGQGVRSWLFARPPPAPAVHPDPASQPGGSIPGEQRLKPSSEWARKGLRARRGKEKALPEET